LIDAKNRKSENVLYQYNSDNMRFFHVYGHSYELDFEGGIGWNDKEKLFKIISDADNIQF